MEVPADALELMIGQRPVPENARRFVPDEAFRPVEIDGPVPDWLWRSSRRRLALNVVTHPHYVSVITLFIPFWSGPGEPLLYEVMLIHGDEVLSHERHATPEAALAAHAQVYDAIRLDLRRDERSVVT